MPASPSTPADEALCTRPESGEPTLGDSALAPVAPLAPLRAGEVLGRYVVIERLGAGGMGVVYAAYDRELDRKVALKLLHGVELDGNATSEGQRKLLREAQAIARLSHPAVVTVHEVAEDDGRVYMAMEFVDGVTLTTWLAREQPPLTRVLAVFLAAGRGLAAAHDAAIVHRDFKPDNVMVGRDGRVRVMDFGLARAGGITERFVVDRDAPELEISRSEGAIGTPAYMAPEQYLGEPVDTRADQFAFCVALFEGVYGRRPFRGNSTAALAHAMISGDLEVPTGKRVPAWLRRVLVRGLSSDPQRRFATMPDLLAELERWPRRLRTLRLAGLATAVVVAVATAGVYAGQRGGPQCDGAPERLDGVTDPATLDAVALALAAQDRPHAAHVASEVRRRLALWHEAWTAEHREACSATHVRGEQSTDRLDRRMTCLAQRRRDAAALVEVLRSADADVLDNAIGAVDVLERPASCVHVAARAAPAERSDDPTLAAARDRLAQAKALDRAGRYAQGQPIASAVLAEARTADEAILVAEAGHVLGILELELGHIDAALVALEDSYYAALAIDHRAAAFSAAITLSYLDAALRERPDEGNRWIRGASAALAGDEDSDLLGELEHARGIVLAVGHHADLAIAAFERAIELYERQPDNELAVAKLHGSIGMELYNVRRLDEALAHMQRALATELEILGPDHPNVAITLNDIANALEHSGRYDEAVEHHRRALAIREQAFGTEHRQVAMSRDNLGLALSRLGRHDEAEQEIRHSLRILEASVGADDRQLAGVTSNLGYVLGRAGRHAEAVPPLERSIALYGRDPERTPAEIAYPLLGLARARLALGDPAAAWPVAERGHTACTSAPLHDTLCATIAMVLARALWDADHDRPRARTLAEQARTIFAARASTHGDEEREATKWLADHPLPP